MSFRTVVEKAKEWLRSFIAAGPIVRFALTAVVGALAGSSVVAFLNKFAVYNYAVSFGCRLPVEGVPYLALAVSLLSLAFFAVIATCAAFTYAIWLLFNRLLHRIFEQRRDMIVGLVSSVATSVVAALLADVVIARRIPFSSWRSFLLAILVLAMLTIVSIRRDWLPVLSLVLAGGLVIFTSARLFLPNSYAAFLRAIRYGGGIPVRVVSATPDSKIREDHGHLMLVTETHYIIFREEHSTRLELPRAHVREVAYPPILKPALPPQSGTLWNLFRHFWLPPVDRPPNPSLQRTSPRRSPG